MPQYNVHRSSHKELGQLYLFLKVCNYPVVHQSRLAMCIRLEMAMSLSFGRSTKRTKPSMAASSDEAEQKDLTRRAAAKMILMLISGSFSWSIVNPTPSPCSRLHWNRP